MQRPEEASGSHWEEIVWDRQAYTTLVEEEEEKKILCETLAEKISCEIIRLTQLWRKKRRRRSRVKYHSFHDSLEIGKGYINLAGQSHFLCSYIYACASKKNTFFLTRHLNLFAKKKMLIKLYIIDKQESIISYDIN